MFVSPTLAQTSSQYKYIQMHWLEAEVPIVPISSSIIMGTNTGIFGFNAIYNSVKVEHDDEQTVKGPIIKLLASNRIIK